MELSTPIERFIDTMKGHAPSHNLFYHTQPERQLNQILLFIIRSYVNVMMTFLNT